MNLHSTGIKDQKHKIICQIADIVWGEGPGGARSDPPETGVLLPGSVTYKKYVQLFAERLVAKTTPALYSDTNYTSNNARYGEHFLPITEPAQYWAIENFIPLFVQLRDAVTHRCHHRQISTKTGRN